MSLTVDATKGPAPATVSPAPVPATVPGQPTAVSPASQPAALPGASVFQSDTADGPDHLARGPDAGFLAELATHRFAGTPFCIGLFGPAGSGKSAFLAAVCGAVERLAEAADSVGLATPFLANVAVVRIEAEPDVPPATTLTRQTFAALAASHPRLASEASHAGLDPRAGAREAGERLNEARQRLDAGRRSLDDLAGRQARLTDSVLFDTAGSQVDTYARAHRARIERSLRRFGFGGDTTATYKELVRDASEPGGALASKAGWLRAFWAYRGQTRLIVLALAFFLIAWGLGLLIGNEDPLIDSVRSSSDKMGATADWLQGHAGWLEPLKQVIEIAGVVFLVLNIVRGVRFLQPLIKGASLLRHDIDTRRRDIDSLLAHQTRRVDSLVAEADLASQHAADAETRLASSATAGLSVVTSPAGSAPPNSQGVDGVRSFFAALGAAVARAANDRLPSSAAAAPARIVFAIDGLDRLPSPQAAAFLATAADLLDQPGFATIVASDRDHLTAGLAETDPALAVSRLNRFVQIPYLVGTTGEPWPESGKFVQALLKSHGATVPARAADHPDPSHSALDMSWLQSEGAVLEALAPFAGRTPRAVKRFVNLYRVARADPRMRGGTAQDLAALALGLALQTAGLPVDPGDPSSYRGLDDDVQQARRAVSAALGTALGGKDNGRGFETARLYSPGA